MLLSICHHSAIFGHDSFCKKTSFCYDILTKSKHDFQRLPLKDGSDLRFVCTIASFLFKINCPHPLKNNVFQKTSFIKQKTTNILRLGFIFMQKIPTFIHDGNNNSQRCSSNIRTADKLPEKVVKTRL